MLTSPVRAFVDVLERRLSKLLHHAREAGHVQLGTRAQRRSALERLQCRAAKCAQVRAARACLRSSVELFHLKPSHMEHVVFLPMKTQAGSLASGNPSRGCR
eukprot:6214745-Pleurochrysis_carterae.AAC.3